MRTWVAGLLVLGALVGAIVLLQHRDPPTGTLEPLGPLEVEVRAAPGASVEATYPFRNRTGRTIVPRVVNSSCGCLTPLFVPDGPIEPNASFTIVMHDTMIAVGPGVTRFMRIGVDDGTEWARVAMRLVPILPAEVTTTER